MAMCENCKYENVCEMPAFIRNDVKRCKVFEEKKPQKPYTNADRIRAMTDEELAEFLCEISKCEDGYCPAYDTCMRTEHGTMKKWLQAEAEKEGE